MAAIGDLVRERDSDELGVVRSVKDGPAGPLHVIFFDRSLGLAAGIPERMFTVVGCDYDPVHGWWGRDHADGDHGADD